MRCRKEATSKSIMEELLDESDLSMLDLKNTSAPFVTLGKEEEDDDVYDEEEEDFEPPPSAFCHVFSGGSGPKTTQQSHPYGTVLGLALDVIVVTPSPQQEEHGNGIIASSDFVLQFPSVKSTVSPGDLHVEIKINGRSVPNLTMLLPGNNRKKTCVFKEGLSTKPKSELLEELVANGILNQRGRNLIRYNLLLTPTAADPTPTDTHPHQLIIGTAEAHLYFWNAHDTIIVSDIDGTVTKSDVRGVLDSIFTEKYEYVHAGVCEFYSALAAANDNAGPFSAAAADVLSPSHAHSNIPRDAAPAGQLPPSATGHGSGHEHNEDRADLITNNKQTRRKRQIRFLYLSSRPFSLVNSTRRFLTALSQPHALDSSSSSDRSWNNFSLSSSSKGHSLPPGPIFCHTGSLSTVLLIELVKKNTHEFKADVLQRQVVIPFAAAIGSSTSAITNQGSQKKLFLAGFGNKTTDAMAYEMVGLEKEEIYIINRDSVIVRMDGLVVSGAGGSNSSSRSTRSYHKKEATAENNNGSSSRSMSISVPNSVRTSPETLRPSNRGSASEDIHGLKDYYTEETIEIVSSVDCGDVHVIHDSPPSLDTKKTNDGPMIHDDEVEAIEEGHDRRTGTGDLFTDATIHVDTTCCGGTCGLNEPFLSPTVVAEGRGSCPSSLSSSLKKPESQTSAKKSPFFNSFMGTIFTGYNDPRLVDSIRGHLHGKHR